MEGDLYVIHALTDGAAEGLEGGEGEMMKRVCALFNEEAPKGEGGKRKPWISFFRAFNSFMYSYLFNVNSGFSGT